ncbi:MAG TPA: hypothetical protein EYP14_17925 [Planctomycetaceae bacterium]|nr:hypothetical protein [Planctomycetaceae bacterium]
MTERSVTDAELLAYLDEQLAAERMVEIEQALRQSESLRTHLATLIQRRDQGAVTVGEVWRRHRLSCPSRSRLGSYLLGVLEPDDQDYIRFHIEVVGCRYCQANLRDLQAAAQATEAARQRRRKFFQSSAGYLSRSKPTSERL